MKFFSDFILLLLVLHKYVKAEEMDNINKTFNNAKMYTIRPWNAIKTASDPTGSAIKFTWGLFRSCKQPQPNSNLVLSPVIIQFLLSVLAEGAAGETKNQINEVIGYSSGLDRLSQHQHKSRSFTNIKLASGVFLDSSGSIKLDPKFEAVTRKLGANIILADFLNQPEEAKGFINRWTMEKTEGFIPNLLSQTYNVQGLQMILGSAIFYKNSWKYKFSNIEPIVFFSTESLSNGTYVPFMESKKDFYVSDKIHFGRGYSGTYVEIPYVNDEYSMILIKPDDNIILETFIRQMDEITFINLIKKLKNDSNKQLMKIRLPKFSINSRFSVVNALLKMGLVDLFTQNSRLPYIIQNKNNLQMSDIIQQAMLIVDEIGTTSTSATSQLFGSNRENEGITLTFNKPFISIILDKKYSVPLFVSKIYNPL